MTSLPDVLLISSGGTIASRTSSEGIGYDPTLGGNELLRTVHGYEKVANVSVREWKNKASYALSIEEVLELAAIIREARTSPNHEAVVITIGTAAMEEVSFLLDLLLPATSPVVITGAMVNASRLGSDGARNILDALRVATHPDACSSGVLVCMAGEVHSAREVRKFHKSSTDAFESWPNGPVALADVDSVIWLRKPRRTEMFANQEVGGPVDIITASLGCDARLLRHSAESGATGIVIEGFPGGGGVTFEMMEEIKRLISVGIPIVLASRSPFGRSVPAAGGGSGPKDIAAAGAILSGEFSAHKARLLLMCALGQTSVIDEIRTIFKEVSP